MFFFIDLFEIYYGSFCSRAVPVSVGLIKNIFTIYNKRKKVFLRKKIRGSFDSIKTICF